MIIKDANGNTVFMGSPAEIAEYGPLQDGDVVIYTAAEQRAAIRKEIAENAGDTLSVLGTTADAAALSTLGMCALTVAVSQATSWATFKTAFTDAIAAMAGDQDMAAISAGFLAKVASGEVKVPALAKGMDAVIADIEDRSTAVSNALIAAQGG